MALAGLTWLGWTWLGWAGIVLGVVLALPLVLISIGLLGVVALGFCAVFDRDEFHRIIGESSPSAPPAEEPLAPVEAPPVRRVRRGQFRIRTYVIVTAVLAVWLGVGGAMVRASKTQRQKETAVLVVVLVPLGIVAHTYALKRVEAWSSRSESLSRRDP